MPFTADPSSCSAGLQYAVTFVDGAVDPYVTEDFSANTLTVEAVAGTTLSAQDYVVTITATTPLSATILNASMTFTVTIVAEPVCEPPTSVTPSTIAD